MRRSATRIVLVDNHPIFRVGLRHCLAGLARFQVVGETSDGEEALGLVGTLRPDLVLLDVGLRGNSGVVMAGRIRRTRSRCRVVMLTMHDEPAVARQCWRAGVDGYVLKETSPAELVRALDMVRAGRRYLAPELAGVLVAGSAGGVGEAGGGLTRREVEVITLVAEGYTTKEIAGVLKVSERTALTHRQNLMAKLRIHNAAGLTRYAVARGLVSARSTGGVGRN